jgi:16S rRNA G966 N2-methylase RsmD
MTKKPNARTFGQDLMRGEHVVGGGKVSKKKINGQTEDLRGGLTHRTTDPYRAKKRAANAQVSGGGGGGWKAHNEKMAANRAKLVPKPRGLAIGTQDWVQGKIESGDIEGGMSSGQTGTSIFDPVLTELCYRWFCPPGGAILDPFAGGSVRGIVASHLGRKYTGVDLSARQLVANRQQAARICKKPVPKWIEGDSRSIGTLVPKDEQFDFVFSCPPYWNLEVYSEDHRDLSTLGADDFFTAQAAIIRAACARLKNNRFAGWIVGDVRDAKGMYVNLPGRSIEAFEAAGLRLYNDAILITAAGSLPIRAGKQFESRRKLGKTHQNCLLFCKGDPVKATKEIGPVDFGSLDAFAASPVPGNEADLASYGRVL